MDVVVWLRSLGLGKYEAAFRENDIDETVLPGLTHETSLASGQLSIDRVGSGYHEAALADAHRAVRNVEIGHAPTDDQPA